MSSDDNERAMAQSRNPSLIGRIFERVRGAATPPSVDEPTAAPALESSATEATPAQDKAADVAAVARVEPATPKAAWWSRLREGLSRSSSSLSQGIAGVFAKRRLDAALLDELEDVLLRADLGVTAASRIRDAVGKDRYKKDVDLTIVRQILAQEVERALTPVATPLRIDETKKPFVILVVGVNGSGKTTTIGKLAAKMVAEGRKVVLAAGDTFRAAAIEQLEIWGARTGVPVVARPQGADPAGLAFDAFKKCQADGVDVLMIDTAGRLQNRTELMAELEKIVRVLKKLDPDAPDAVLLILDATIGQNAISQVEIFSRVAGVTGLVMTKLDGTARGGILVAIAERFGLPVHYIGVGEAVDDLEPFSASDFARAIAGIE